MLILRMKFVHKPDLKREDVEARVNDWLVRIGQLYELVKNNVPVDRATACRVKRHVLMHEEMMQKFDIPAVQVPVLDVLEKNSIVVTFKPKGLWVVGANGRIDVLTQRASYIIIDAAAVFRPAHWMIYGPRKKASGEEFNVNTLQWLMS